MKKYLHFKVKKLNPNSYAFVKNMEAKSCKSTDQRQNIITNLLYSKVIG
jgi:hypothetical protein